MSVSLKPISEIKVNLGINENGAVQSFLTNTCYKHMDKYVPKRNENLRTVVEIETDKITYQSPYAHYQYIGQREDGSHKVRNYTTAGTGTYWDKKMVSAEIKDVVKEVQGYIGGKR